MRFCTVSSMSKIDECCVNEYRIPGIVLMENAALKVFEKIKKMNVKSAVVICGRGNNGGDGFALSRHMIACGMRVSIFMGVGHAMSGDCTSNYNILNNMGAEVVKVAGETDLKKLRKALKDSDIAVDALFGTGISRNIDGINMQIINEINANANYVVSIDVPSGFDSDTGNILGKCVKANMTVTFEMYKKGFLNPEAEKHTGKIFVENIGIPEKTFEKFSNKYFLTDKEMIKDVIPVRDEYSNKGDFGRVLIIAGSKGFTGASYIASEAAVKSGSGLVTLGCRPEIQFMLSSMLKEAMTVSIEDSAFIDAVHKSKAIAFGPGMGNSDDTLSILKLVLQEAKCPIVIDADGLNVLSGKLDILKDANQDIVITPHPGEMARLLNEDTESINKNRIEISEKFASDYNVIVLLKGHNTVVTDGNKVYVNTTGSSAMATGGMGDCLTGMIASLIGQGINPLESSYAAAFIHGYIGDSLAEKMYSVNAEELINNIPFFMKKLCTGEE